jgi:hypothetical protein
MLCPVTVVRTDVWKELGATVVRVTKISELGTTLAVTSKRSTLRKNASVASYGQIFPSSTVLTKITQRNIPEEGILHSYLFIYLLGNPT